MLFERSRQVAPDLPEVCFAILGEERRKGRFLQERLVVNGVGSLKGIYLPAGVQSELWPSLKFSSLLVDVVRIPRCGYMQSKMRLLIGVICSLTLVFAMSLVLRRLRR